MVATRLAVFVKLATISLVALGAVTIFCLPAHAEDEQLAPPPVTTQPSAGGGGAKSSGGGQGKKKETKISFEDEAIEGELKKPELFYMFQKKQFNFKRLIKLRDDFLPEMRRDADEVRRGRSK